MSNDIELPPLPASIPCDEMGRVLDIASVMQAYAREAVRAAVERERELQANTIAALRDNEVLWAKTVEERDARIVELQDECVVQAKAEKGLEPVAWRYQPVHHATVWAYAEVKQQFQESANWRQEALYTHPPTQVEPVAHPVVWWDEMDAMTLIPDCDPKWKPLYAHPPTQVEPVAPHLAALDVLPILYTDTINGRQVCRDDLWAITSETVAAIRAHPPTSECDHRWSGASRNDPDAVCVLCGVPKVNPPTSEWNAAEVADLIEALWRGDEGADADAAQLIGRLTGVTTEHLPARALKREPR